MGQSQSSGPPLGRSQPTLPHPPSHPPHPPHPPPPPPLPLPIALRRSLKRVYRYDEAADQPLRHWWTGDQSRVSPWVDRPPAFLFETDTKRNAPAVEEIKGVTAIRAPSELICKLAPGIQRMRHEGE